MPIKKGTTRNGLLPIRVSIISTLFKKRQMSKDSGTFKIFNYVCNFILQIYSHRWKRINCQNKSASFFIPLAFGETFSFGCVTCALIYVWFKAGNFNWIQRYKKFKTRELYRSAAVITENICFKCEQRKTKRSEIKAGLHLFMQYKCHRFAFFCHRNAFLFHVFSHFLSYRFAFCQTVLLLACHGHLSARNGCVYPFV